MTHAARVDGDVGCGRICLALLLSRTQTCCAHQHQCRIAQLSLANATNVRHKTESQRTERRCYICQFVVAAPHAFPAFVVISLLVVVVATIWHVNRQSHFSNSCTHSLLCICLRHCHTHTHTHTRLNERRVTREPTKSERET